MLPKKAFNVSRLAETKSTIGAIASNSYAKVIAVCTYIGYLEFGMKCVFDALNVLFRRARKQNVIYIKSNNGASFGVSKDSKIGIHLFKAALMDKIRKGIELDPRGLFETIEGFLELVHALGRLCIYITGGLLDVNFFFDIAIKKSSFDIYLL